MLDIIYGLVTIVAAIFWLLAIYFGISFILDTEWGDKTNKGPISLVLLIMALLFSVGGWYVDVKVSIKKDLAEIKAYEIYKSNYEANKIIDTEIEKKYVDAIQELEYYKSIGLYNGTTATYRIPTIVKEGIKEGAFNKTNKDTRRNNDSNDEIEKYGIKGEVKGRPGRLYNEKFYEEVGPGNYKEMEIK